MNDISNCSPKLKSYDIVFIPETKNYELRSARKDKLPNATIYPARRTSGGSFTVVMPSYEVPSFLKESKTKAVEISKPLFDKLYPANADVRQSLYNVSSHPNFLIRFNDLMMTKTQVLYLFK